MKIEYYQIVAACARELTHDKEMMSDSWRAKILAAGNKYWEGKRMRQLLDRMDRMSGDRQEIVTDKYTDIRPYFTS